MTEDTKAEAPAPATKTPTLDEIAAETVKDFIGNSSPIRTAAALARALGGLAFTVQGDMAKLVAEAKSKEFAHSTDPQAGVEKAKHDTRVQHAERALVALHKAEAGFNAAAQALSEHEIHADRSKSVK